MRSAVTDVIVVGGGPAGMTAALAFAVAGFEVVCVDPAATRAEKSNPQDLRSTAFLTPAVALLSDIGLWDRLEASAAPLKTMRIIDAGGAENVPREIADFNATDIGQDVFGYNIPNASLRTAMMAALAEHPRVHLIGGVFEHLTPRVDHALVRLSDGESLRAKLVLAADGRDSAVREDVGLAVRRWGLGQKALVFHVEHEEPHQDVSIEIHRTGGPFTLVPLAQGVDGRHSAVVWMERGATASALASAPREEFENALNARSCGVLGRLKLVSPIAMWPIISQIADRLDAPRTALVAEAAHVMPPIGAQGLNTSLQDIGALRDLCVSANASGGDIGAPGVLRRYDRSRRPDMLARVTGVDALNRAAMTDNAALRDLRRLGLRALHAGPLRKAVMRAGLGAGVAQSLDNSRSFP